MLQVLILSLFFSFSSLYSSNIESMSLEEKIGQLLMVHFHGKTANENAATLIQKLHVGGIIYYNWSNALNSPSEVKALSDSLQQLVPSNRPPLLIAVDQEGGIVNRLSNGFTVFPGNAALGAVGDPTFTEKSSFAIGQELRSVGITINLAPVIDVNNNPRNPVIGIRSFGSDPETVAALGKYALLGYKQAKILATPKHFPGHGNTSVDSHEDLPVLSQSLEELEKMELLPFKRLAPLADVIMTGHLLVPALDKDHPTTFSKETLSYLRKNLNFNGAVITDSLVMQGILKRCPDIEEAALMAFNAGHDILLLGGKSLNDHHSYSELTVSDIERIHKFLVRAVKTGKITEERLNQAVERILTLKEKISSEPTPMSSTLLEEHRILSKEIARLALKTKGKKITLDNKKVLIIAPRMLSIAILHTNLVDGLKKTIYFFNAFNPRQEEVEEIKDRVQGVDEVIVFSYNAWKNPAQEAFIKELISLEKPVTVVVTRDPVDNSLFPGASEIITTFSPTPVSINAAVELLLGQ